MRYDSILGTIGNTPAVRINNIDTHGTTLYVKIEAFNPMGSVKDRLALGVIEDAEARGELQPGQTVVEATSGNTGIGLAMVCAQKGYPLVVTMAENFSVERRKLMRFLGAKVVLTPAHEKGSGMVAKAVELAEAHGWWQSRQFENPANAAIHERTTAVEILNDFADLPLDYWVTGFGTAGTLNGVSRVLKEKSPHTRVMVCEPDNAPILASGIGQPEAGSHPSFRPHLMQGWSPDFIPKLAQQVLDGARIDGYLPIDGNKALECCAELAQKEGIFVGISAGATFAGALEVAKQAPDGSTLLCMLPDTGERYLTTPLFVDVPEQMTEEEMAISRSTPGYRFDVSHAPPPPADDTPQPLDEAAAAEVAQHLADTKQPVVMFALEWCEFCWSVRKVFKQYGIDYRSVDLDSVAYQADNRGGKIRAVLKDKTGWNTLPQIFIKGEFIGGCTDLFDQLKDGSMAARLKENAIPYDQSVTADPYQQLPSWLHPR
ncbi:pyridoxal-phosphate dependent enzyme [Ferrimonas balearica]|uniref:pyridoxal-phosphate dependent enzyme n=1 Tax=Ferrimonas balearica TaxID=44012 RepID=UPI001C9A0C30|nr:pyridoxal-phosphate dependent enzyme [Ferrimonas balearica]MBY5992418.1 pyridoxal-phosphate dependent enzyme [Ferrimonas balearica]